MSFFPVDLFPRGRDNFTPGHGDVGGLLTTDVRSSRLQRSLLTSVVVAWSDIQAWAELQGERLPRALLAWRKWGLSPLGHLMLLFYCSWHLCGTLSPRMFSLMPSWVRTHDGDCYKPSVAFATISFAVLETTAFSNTQPPAAVGTAAFSHGALVTMVTAHDLSPASFSASCRAPSTTFATVS